ncbi:MAG: L-lactate dehydrogenase [Clostridia bacterium]|nr:L-lactate dehydrogenase [Clostridia bacterium]MDD7701107.1 L-lactate dehydrogenase [Eubacteriales bacterium]MDY2826590.1 L-lactate dehydrogenase [Eubacteriales bacterium]
MKKITIIGAGNVGATIAYTLAVDGVANEIVIIDVKEEKAKGEVMDINQGGLYFEDVNLHAGDYVDAADSDIVIITSGLARKPGQSRLDLAQANVNILCSIAPQITRYAPNAVYLIVSNPVDIMTYVFHKVTNIPESRILGSGTSLDTARLRYRIGKDFGISLQNVHAYVFGEHGDSSFIPWSQAEICTVGLDKYYEEVGDKTSGTALFNKDRIEEYVRTSGATIISRKGATYYAVALSAVQICKHIFSSTYTGITVSTMMHGEYGLDDICLSVLTAVGPGGVRAHLHADLSEEEIQKLHHSADCLRAVMNQIKF